MVVTAITVPVSPQTKFGISNNHNTQTWQPWTAWLTVTTLLTNAGLFLKEHEEMNPQTEGQHSNAFCGKLSLSLAARNRKFSCQSELKQVEFPSSECRSSSCQVTMPANVFSGRGSPLFMNLLSPASVSSLRLYLDLTAFWTQYPGSRHGDTSMLQRSTLAQFHIWGGSTFPPLTHHLVKLCCPLFNTGVFLYSLMIH